MDAHQEMLGIINRIWIKLQGLPQAEALEIGAFTVLIVFVATFILMVVISCTTCCSARAKRKSTKVQPV